jgi:hypothetical protein
MADLPSKEGFWAPEEWEFIKHMLRNTILFFLIAGFAVLLNVTHDVLKKYKLVDDFVLQTTLFLERIILVIDVAWFLIKLLIEIYRSTRASLSKLNT